MEDYMVEAVVVVVAKELYLPHSFLVLVETERRGL